MMLLGQRTTMQIQPKSYSPNVPTRRISHEVPYMIGKDYTLVEDLLPCAVLYKIGKKCAPVEAPWQLPIMDAALHFGLAWTQH